MKNFREELKVKDFTNFENKVKENMLTALSKTETVDELEKAKKLEMQMNMTKILNNYDEVIQILIKNKNKNKEDFER